MADRLLKRTKPSVYCFLISFFFAFALSGVYPLLAQEEELSPEERAAVIQFTAQFRFGSDLKVGDWVRYRYLGPEDSTRQIELKVTGEEEGALWIVETLTNQSTNTTSAIHLLANLPQQKFLQIFMIDEKGEKQTLPSLRIDQFYTIVVDMMTKAGEEGAIPPFGWRKGVEQKEVAIGDRSFTCEYLEPDIDEEEEEEVEEALKEEATSRLGLGRLKKLVEKPEDISDITSIKDEVESLTSIEGLKGHVDIPDLDDLEEIAELIATQPFKRQNLPKTPLYFSEKVPRLIPYEITMGFFMSPQTLKEVQGGLVKFGSLELSAYGTGE